MNKKLTILFVSLSLFTLSLSACEKKEEVVVKNVPKQNETQDNNLAKIPDYEQITNLKLKIGERSVDEATGKISAVISLEKISEAGFDSKSIQGITFMVENLPNEVRSLDIQNSELTKEWMFAKNLEQGKYLKASMITLEKMSELGIVARLTLDKNELDLLKEDLIIKTEITDGNKMYKLEEVKLKLKN